jgi:ATP/maltotriose-dependent transcriptional regulator MalT
MMLFREIGSQWGIAESLAVLAQVEAGQGDLAAARTLYEESLMLARERNYKDLLPSCLEGLAGVVATQGEPVWAARLWGAAESLREDMGVPIPLSERAGYERAVTATRLLLEEQTFAAVWTEGRTMSLEQVLAARGIAEIPALISTEPSSAPSARMPPTFPAGLTAREMDVLRLLAQGLTSAQIAEQLVIGLVTVNSHVRSIYSKLEISSRAAATRYALEHKLL